jgi:hypothetical protein
MNNRLKFLRVDNEARRFDIEVVRKLLFEKGVTITSVKIDRIMGPKSTVPTRVSFNVYLIVFKHTYSFN